jgi:hypothetical protein
MQALKGGLTLAPSRRKAQALPERLIVLLLRDAYRQALFHEGAAPYLASCDTGHLLPFLVSLLPACHCGENGL